MNSWTVISLLRAATDHLKSKGIDGARLDAELLLAEVLKTDRLGLYVGSEELVTDADRARFRGLIQRRCLGEPVAYLLGWREFYGHRVKSDARALVPRPETELLVDEALRILKCRDAELGPARVLDLCTGTGCIAIAIAKAVPLSVVVAVDISADALELARENVRELGVDDRVSLVLSDLYGRIPTEARFDLIIGNPPYVTEAEWSEAALEVREHEPRVALVAALGAFEFHRRILAGAGPRLRERGCVLLEISDQADVPSSELLALLDRPAALRILADHAGLQRLICVSVAENQERVRA